MQALTTALRNLEPVCILPHGTVLQITPGARYAPLPVELAPRFGVVRFVPVGDGTFRPTIEIHDHWVRYPVAEKLLGLDIQSLYRLVDAGFVEGRQPTPHTRQISLESFFKHCRTVQDDPDFWLKTSHKKRFSQAVVPRNGPNGKRDKTAQSAP